jgi:molybdenum cofactor cytidylyltransferase
MISVNDLPDQTGIIMLAAGASTRLGEPKQLLTFKGRTLLEISLAAACASEAHPVIVVLGANAELLSGGIDGYDVHTIINMDWQEGLASSIRAGLKALLEIIPSVNSALLMLCDQPMVTASLLNELISAHQRSGLPIVSCGYADTYGPPTLFQQRLFAELLALKGDVGAKRVLHQHRSEVELIAFPDGALDIDSREDYLELSKGI